MSPRRGLFRSWLVRPREWLGELLAMAGMLSLLLLLMTKPDWDDLSGQVAWAAAGAGTTGVGIYLLLTERGRRRR